MDIKNIFLCGSCKLLLLLTLLFVSPTSYAGKLQYTDNPEYTAKSKSAGLLKWEISPKHYQEWRLGYGTSTENNGMKGYLGRVILGTIQGVNFNEYLQAGIGIDGIMYTHYYPNHNIRWALDVYADVRGFYPIYNDLKVYLDLGLGVFFSTLNAKKGLVYGKNKTSFFCQFGPGIQYKKWTLSLGLNHIGKKTNTFYTTIGFTF